MFSAMLPMCEYIWCPRSVARSTRRCSLKLLLIHSSNIISKWLEKKGNKQQSIWQERQPTRPCPDHLERSEMFTLIELVNVAQFFYITHTSIHIYESRNAHAMHMTSTMKIKVNLNANFSAPHTQLSIPHSPLFRTKNINLAKCD